jgi:transcriptional regulator with GAF, ATPase, and Fis domain
MLLEKYKFYDIFRNINRIIINSKKIQTFIKKTFKEIEKIDFIDISIIYLKKRDRVFRFNRDCKINEKEIKNELKIILNKLEKEEYLIKKSENFLNYKYSIFFPLKYEKELIGLINFLSNNSIVLKRQNLVYLKEISNSINLGISKFIDKERIMEKEREHEKKIKSYT